VLKTALAEARLVPFFYPARTFPSRIDPAPLHSLGTSCRGAAANILFPMIQTIPWVPRIQPHTGTNPRATQLRWLKPAFPKLPPDLFDHKPD